MPSLFFSWYCSYFLFVAPMTPSVRSAQWNKSMFIFHKQPLPTTIWRPWLKWLHRVQKGQTEEDTEVTITVYRGMIWSSYSFPFIFPERQFSLQVEWETIQRFTELYVLLLFLKISFNENVIIECRFLKLFASSTTLRGTDLGHW